MGTWHVPFPLFVLGRRMNFCVSARCLQFFVLGESAQCMFVCMCLGLALPCRVAAARANPFAGILVIFLLLCSFVVVFRCRFINLVTSLFTHYTG